jgi:predicted RNase H-like HicB family nuclease
MVAKVYSVRAEWDCDAGVWVATSDEVPGLATEAGTFDGLVEKLRVIVPELLEANGVLPASEAASASFRVSAERIEHSQAVA